MYKTETNNITPVQSVIKDIISKLSIKHCVDPDKVYPVFKGAFAFLEFKDATYILLPETHPLKQATEIQLKNHNIEIYRF